MKLISTLLLLTISCLPTTHAQAIRNKKVKDDAAKTASSKAQLQLTTSIVEQKYHCSNFVGLKVRLTFKNIGAEPVILDKRSFITRVLVSRDLKAAAAKLYESNSYFDYFGDGAYFNVDPSDMSNFIVLRSGEVYAFDSGVRSFWIDAGTTPLKGYLSPGTHFLQIQVNTWSYFTDSKPFRQQWKDKGFLWSEGLISLPMSFTVNENNYVAKCTSAKINESAVGRDKLSIFGMK